MRFTKQYMNMTEIGSIFGTTGHKVGKWLKEIGLRNEFGDPARHAYEQKMISADFDRHGTYNVLWDAAKVVPLLRDGGHEPASPPPAELVEPPVLLGPFTVQPAEGGVHRVVGDNGDMAISVIGEANAQAVQHVLNVAHKSGHLDRIVQKYQ